MSKSKAKIHQDRIKLLKDPEIVKGKYVMYWMQQSQRVEWNHALEFAIDQANQLDLPLIVVFGLIDDYPEANLRHYTFMLQGLRYTEKALKERKIKLIVSKGHPVDVALKLSRDAAMVVCDLGYLRHQKEWRQYFKQRADKKIYQVESDVVVPVETVSGKAEYAARTIRPKLHKSFKKYLDDPGQLKIKNSSLDLRIKGLNLSNPEQIARSLKLDQQVTPSSFFTGGTDQAKQRLKNFFSNHLHNYAEARNRPELNHISHMSMYLHFGQVAPTYIVNEIMRKKNGENADAYIEELMVRRELSMNYVHYTKDYDTYQSKPEWARKSLEKHRNDERPHQYTRKQLENAETHDEYWNASMKEMKHTGFMHGYMRMYWGKKIIEWSNTPEYAFKTVLYLNNKYFIDGRDANSFTNVSWLFGQHDRGWPEREVFGKVRSMKASGLKRKFKPEKYVEKVEKLIESKS